MASFCKNLTLRGEFKIHYKIMGRGIGGLFVFANLCKIIGNKWGGTKYRQIQPTTQGF